MKRRLLAILIAAALLAFGEWLWLYWLPVRHARSLPLNIQFFDIGQGDSILLHQGNRQLLVDSGPDRVVLSRLGKALPYLDRELETVIVTHPHDDHTGGLEALFSRYRIGRLILPEPYREDRGFKSAVSQANGLGVEISWVSRGARLWLTGSTALTVIWPPSDCLELLESDQENDSHYDPANSCSLVMRLDNCDELGCRRALLTGDATAASERFLLRSGDGLAADLLKVGHHGSRYSSTKDFLQAVGPQQAIIQVGQFNRFGHPDYGVILRLRALGAAVWRNDLNGTITAYPGHQGFIIEAEKSAEPDS